MSEEYSFVRISPAAFPDFIRLSKAVTGVDQTVAELERMFDTENFGAQYVGYLAYDANREPAAFYGVFPVTVEYNGRAFLAAQSGSTMTHPRHQKKGLFVKLGQKTFELARELGVEFVFGFPNEKSHRGLTGKLKFVSHENFNSYHFFVPTAPFGLLAERWSALKSLHQKYARFVLSFWQVPTTAFPNSVMENNVGGVRHDENWLRYKQTSHGLVIKINNRRVWLNLQMGRLGIGEIENLDELPNINQILRKIRRLAFLCGIIHVRTYASPNCKLDKLLRAAGYRPRQGLAICTLNLSGALPSENFKYVYVDFDTF